MNDLKAMILNLVNFKLCGRQLPGFPNWNGEFWELRSTHFNAAKVEKQWYKGRKFTPKPRSIILTLNFCFKQLPLKDWMIDELTHYLIIQHINRDYGLNNSAKLTDVSDQILAFWYLKPSLEPDEKLSKNAESIPLIPYTTNSLLFPS